MNWLQIEIRVNQHARLYAYPVPIGLFIFGCYEDAPFMLK